MKTKLFTAIIAFTLMFTACESAGTTIERLNGDESSLPDELKGLKVYSVCTSNGNYIKVAILEDKIIGTNYSKGKYTESVAIIDRTTENKRIIEVKEIISENDSIIVIKKK